MVQFGLTCYTATANAYSEPLQNWDAGVLDAPWQDFTGQTIHRDKKGQADH